MNPNTSHERILKDITLRGVPAVAAFPEIPERFARSFKMYLFDQRGPGKRRDDALSDFVSQLGCWEGYETLLAMALLHGGDRRELVVDFGAQLGWYTLLAASFGYRTLAVDEDPEPLALLAESAALNGFEDLVVPLRMRADPDLGPLDFDALSRGRPDVDTASPPRARAGIALMKLDIEGGEAEAVRACWSYFEERLVRAALIEITPFWRQWIDGQIDMLRRIASLGYELFDIPEKDSRDRAAFTADPLSAIRAYRVDPACLTEHLRGVHQTNFLVLPRSPSSSDPPPPSRRSPPVTGPSAQPSGARRVLYIGNFEPPFSTENHVRASLQELGVEVVPAQESALPIPALDRMLGGIDLLLYTRTWGLQGGDALRWITSLPIPTVSYHLDLYAGISRGRHIGSDPFWRSQHVFTPDGGSEAFFRSQGVRHHYLPAGVYGAECYLAEPDPERRADVCFVGSYDYHPEWPYRRRLVDFLSATYGRRFRKHGPPESIVRGHDLNRLYASVKVVVGDSLCVGFDHSFYWSDRVYETLGRGGFLIHPYIFGMERELRDREHLVFYPFGDFAALRRLIDYYVSHDDEREAIRRAGHEHVKATCTYVHRMRSMLGALGEHHESLRGWVGC